MTLLLALSVLLASPCHLAAPEIFFFFFQGSWSWCVSLHFFVFVTLRPAWGAGGGGVLSLCFKDRSQSSFHAVWGGWEYWKLGSCPLFPLELFPSFHQNIGGTLLGFPQWGKGGIGALLGFPPVRQGGEGGILKAVAAYPARMGHPILAHKQKWISEYSLSLFKDNVVLETMIHMPFSA
jgi:hypothetical protein